MILSGLKVGLVGPLPPPAGGMANQTMQLAELLRREGAAVTLVQTNKPVVPGVAARVRGLRAIFRLVPYAVRLWKVAGEVDLFHIMANSGWSWHLIASPAIRIASLRGTPAVVNYRGGEAATFLARSAASVRRALRRSSALVVPSAFLQEVFGRFAMRSDIVPNIVDLERFRPADAAAVPKEAHLVVARNLEAIYDIPTALRAFALVRARVPAATLTIAGSGPELDALRALAATLGIADAVDFCGRLDRDQMAALYRSARVVMNPSAVDNMPNSVLEAMASGVPVVSTNVGGIPFILRHGVNGLLVEAGDDRSMAAFVVQVLEDGPMARRLRDAALDEVQQYSWSRVRARWESVYASLRPQARAEARPA